MINITRPDSIPESLQRPEIKKYLDDLLDFKSGITNTNPEHPYSYRNSDILDIFTQAFYSKCYLTEEKYFDAHEMDIDHFEAVNGAEHKRYEWSNLLPASHKANMARSRVFPTGGLLDPCNPLDDVEQEILYSLSILGEDPRFEARDPSNIKAVNTAKELHIVHNGKGTIETENNTKHLRLAIERKWKEVANAIIRYQGLSNQHNKASFQAKRELKDLLSRKSSFTMLIRSSAIVEAANLPTDFFD